jgi:hypothetical protein
MIQPFQYYRKTVDTEDEGIPIGEIVLIASISSERVDFVWHKQHFYTDPQSFEMVYALDPEGSKKRQEEILQLMREIQDLNAQTSTTHRQLASFSPHIENPGSETALIVQGEESSKALKTQVTNFRNALMKIQVSLEEKQEELESLLAEQSKALALRMKDMKGMVNRAEEVIWTVNLYLGKRETLLLLQDGKAAPAEEKICIRQKALYMDEESALNPELGGIDFKQLTDFDKWVIIPKNLQQVLPEPKGVVALRIRKTAKEYTEDPWLNTELNKRNFETYFLMRNGEKIWRIQTELSVKDNLFPLRNEFNEIFTQSSFGEKRVIFPGDSAYMDCMKQANEHNRHYMRILLFLQGLLDRTPVFQPLPAPRINILDEYNHLEYIRYIKDAEEDRQLPTGRVPFFEWLKEINEKLEVGHRIVGAFHSQSGLYEYSYHGSNERIYPPRAGLPSDKQIYVIESSKNENLCIRFNRGDTVYRYSRWGGYDDGPAKKRASCRLERSDRFILNVDVANEEDMQFYLDSRVDRPAYAHMFPVLKLALQLKADERKAEEPFVKLLAGQIMQKYGIDYETAEKSVPELVYWWKFKNHTHRALTSEDAKALRMIVAEYGLRQRRMEERSQINFDECLKQLTLLNPTALYIGHKEGNDFIVLLPANEENIFVEERLFTKDGSVWKMDSEQKITVVDQRYLRWHKLYETERFKNWKPNVRPLEWLTPREQADALDYIKREFPAICKDQRLGWSGWDEDARQQEEKRSCCNILAVTIDDEHKICVYVHDMHVATTKFLLTKGLQALTISYCKLSWTKKRSGVTFDLRNSDYNRLSNYGHFWENEKDENFPERPPLHPKRILFINEQNIKNAEKEVEVFEAKKAVQKALEKQVSDLIYQLQEQIETIWWTKKKAAYLAEYHEDILWEREKKKIHYSSPVHNWDINYMLQHLVEQGISCIGLSVKEVIAMAKKYGWKDEKGDKQDPIVKKLPANFVFQAPLPPEPEKESEKSESQKYKMAIDFAGEEDED